MSGIGHGTAVRHELDRGTAVEAVQPLMAQSDRRFHVVADERPAWVDEQGLLIVVGCSDVRVGFGVRTGLRVGSALVSAISRWNQQDRSGHLWLAEDDDEPHWSLVWGMTLPFQWMSHLSLQRALYTRLATEPRDGAVLQARFAGFGGQEYWSSLVERWGDIQVTGRVLWGHLA